MWARRLSEIWPNLVEGDTAGAQADWPTERAQRQPAAKDARPWGEYGNLHFFCHQLWLGNVRSFILILTQNNGSELKTVQVRGGLVGGGYLRYTNGASVRLNTERPPACFAIAAKLERRFSNLKRWVNGRGQCLSGLHITTVTVRFYHLSYPDEDQASCWLLDEHADDLAEAGRTFGKPDLCPGPQKYGSFWPRVKLAF